MSSTTPKPKTLNVRKTYNKKVRIMEAKMVVEMIKMSSKGQIVIPRKIRKKLHAEGGTHFAVIEGEDNIVLKKVNTPSKEELIKDLDQMAKEGTKRAKKRGIGKKDVPDLVHKSREKK